jgi:hypothetical protein
VPDHCRGCEVDTAAASPMLLLLDPDTARPKLTAPEAACAAVGLAKPLLTAAAAKPVARVDPGVVGLLLICTTATTPSLLCATPPKCSLSRRFCSQEINTCTSENPLHAVPHTDSTHNICMVSNTDSTDAGTGCFQHYLCCHGSLLLKLLAAGRRYLGWRGRLRCSIGRSCSFC